MGSDCISSWSLLIFLLCTTCNYRKRLSDTWWLLSMRLRTPLGHGQYLFLCKAHRRSIEIRASQIVGCWSWIIQACVSVTFQWKFLREPSKNIHEIIEILRSIIELYFAKIRSAYAWLMSNVCICNKIFKILCEMKTIQDHTAAETSFV